MLWICVNIHSHSQRNAIVAPAQMYCWWTFTLAKQLASSRSHFLLLWSLSSNHISCGYAVWRHLAGN